MNTKYLALSSACAILLSACGGGGGGGPATTSVAIMANATPSTVPMNCAQDYSLLQANNFYANPNSWNKGSITNFTNCVGVAYNGTNIVGDIKYDWPYAPISYANGAPIKAYPAIVYGNKPGLTPANDKLPKQITAINSLPITWDITSTRSNVSSGALFFDVWLTTTANASGLSPSQGTTVEMGITLDVWGDLNNTCAYNRQLCGVPIVNIDGEQYYFIAGNDGGAYNNQYVGSNSQYRVNFARVNYTGTSTSGTINLKSFLNYVVNNNLIPGNLYVSSIELGAELAYGSGEIQINRYNININ